MLSEGRHLLHTEPWIRQDQFDIVVVGDDPGFKVVAVMYWSFRQHGRKDGCGIIDSRSGLQVKGVHHEGSDLAMLPL